MGLRCQNSTVRRRCLWKMTKRYVKGCLQPVSREREFPESQLRHGIYNSRNRAKQSSLKQIVSSGNFLFLFGNLSVACIYRTILLMGSLPSFFLALSRHHLLRKWLYLAKKPARSWTRSWIGLKIFTDFLRHLTLQIESHLYCTYLGSSCILARSGTLSHSTSSSLTHLLMESLKRNPSGQRNREGSWNKGKMVLTLAETPIFPA